MSLAYIETTYEPILNLSRPLDESSLEPYPCQEPTLSSDEEVNLKTIANKVDNCIKIVIGVEDKLLGCTLTKLDLLYALENTLTDLKKIKLILSFI